MEPVEKQKKRQYQVEQENKWLDEAAKKKQKWQFDEIHHLEEAAKKKMERQNINRW